MRDQVGDRRASCAAYVGGTVRDGWLMEVRGPDVSPGDADPVIQRAQRAARHVHG